MPHKHREEVYVKKELETVVIVSITKLFKETPEGERGKEDSPLEFWTEYGSAGTLILDFWPIEL